MMKKTPVFVYFMWIVDVDEDYVCLHDNVAGYNLFLTVKVPRRDHM